MGEEIEKKFLLREDGIDYASTEIQTIYSSFEELMKDVLENGKAIKQGYLILTDGQELSDKLDMDFDFKPTEARLRNKAGKLYFTLKGKGGLSRNEVETEVGENLFMMFWPLTENRRVEKVRLDIPYQSHTLEIDVYTDRDLVVAEIEVPTVEEANSLKTLGLDVTEDSKYKNKNLAK